MKLKTYGVLLFLILIFVNPASADSSFQLSANEMTVYIDVTLEVEMISESDNEYSSLQISYEVLSDTMLEIRLLVSDHIILDGVVNYVRSSTESEINYTSEVKDGAFYMVISSDDFEFEEEDYISPGTFFMALLPGFIFLIATLLYFYIKKNAE